MDPILTSAASAPRVTFYDDATGERVELSAVTLMNWAAKTANLLRDSCGADAGARVRVLLPAHWQTAAALLGCWWAGCEVLTADAEDAGDGAAVDVAFLAESGRDGDAGTHGDAALAETDAALAEADDVLVLSLDAFGRPAAGLPDGAIDYATEVRMHGDTFRPQPVDAAAPALDGSGIADVLGAARSAAERLGLTAADRVLSSARWDSGDELTGGLLAPLAAGASIVQVAHPDPAPGAVERRIATEKITRTLG